MIPSGGFDHIPVKSSELGGEKFSSIADQLSETCQLAPEL